jgi:PhzF family phenazine biosynthesis protein
MQKIAFENNLAETAFLVKKDGYYDLRWFTPEVEIDLCGHATLGSAFILLNYIETDSNQIEFHTQSGVLTVRRDKNKYIMNFPRRKPVPCPIPSGLERALGVKISETHIARDLVAVVENEDDVRNLCPDISLLKEINNVFAVMITAKGIDSDFVSRFFAPNAGICEDPVTGSAHCILIPFWSERLNKTEMIAKQLSQRGGILYCKDFKEADRVEIGGNAVCYLSGEIML